MCGPIAESDKEPIVVDARGEPVEERSHTCDVSGRRDRAGLLGEEIEAVPVHLGQAEDLRTYDPQIGLARVSLDHERGGNSALPLVIPELVVESRRHAVNPQEGVMAVEPDRTAS